MSSGRGTGSLSVGSDSGSTVIPCNLSKKLGYLSESLPVSICVSGFDPSWTGGCSVLSVFYVIGGASKSFVS